MKHIQSHKNPFAKHLWTLLRDAKYRWAENTLALEGKKAVYDALSRGHVCTGLVLREKDDFLIPEHVTCPLYVLSDDAFERTSLMRQATGVIGLFDIPTWSPSLWQNSGGQVALLDAVQSPQNVGAIIRNAAAFGVSAVLLLPGCADPTHPEVLRASSGYALDVPFFRCLPEEVSALAKRFHVYILSAQADSTVGNTPMHTPCLWVLGNEGQGPSWHVPHAIPLRIPMLPNVDSLNVSVASGICFHAGFTAKEGPHVVSPR